MAAPAAFDLNEIAAKQHHLLGPLIVAFAGSGAAECTRAIRFWIVPPALWFSLMPLWADLPFRGSINCTVTGVALIALSFVRGRVQHPYNGGWLGLFHTGGAATPNARVPNRR